jgi:hypothetical protein
MNNTVSMNTKEEGERRVVAAGIPSASATKMK